MHVYALLNVRVCEYMSLGLTDEYSDQDSNGYRMERRQDDKIISVLDISLHSQNHMLEVNI